MQRQLRRPRLWPRLSYTAAPGTSTSSRGKLTLGDIVAHLSYTGEGKLSYTGEGKLTRMSFLIQHLGKHKLTGDPIRIILLPEALTFLVNPRVHTRTRFRASWFHFFHPTAVHRNTVMYCYGCDFRPYTPQAKVDLGSW